MKNNLVKKLCIILSIILFLLIGVCVGINIKNNKEKPLSNENNTETQKMELIAKNAKIDVSNLKTTYREENDYSRNVNIMKYFYYENPYSKDTGLGGELQIYGKNNNNEAVEINAELCFYDKDGYLIDYKSDKINVLPNTEFGLSILAYSSKDYYSCAVEYKINKSKSYYKFLENVKTAAINKIENDSISITYKNETSSVVDMIRYTCILYSNREVIGVLKTYAPSVDSGSSATTTCYNSNKLEYDDYKVILSESYNYTEEQEKWN